MKIRLVTDTELPGGFVIEAETPEECLILRMFVTDERKICIANFGGNIGENRYSFMISHYAERPNTASRPTRLCRPQAENKRARSGLLSTVLRRIAARLKPGS